MTLSKAMSVAATGMTAERFRMDVTAGNLANANTQARFPGDQVYARQIVEVQGGENGVEIVRTLPAEDGTKTEYIPGHPGADPRTGMVLETNVNPVAEMVDMMGATRAYEANIQAFNAAKGMAKSALNIGKA